MGDNQHQPQGIQCRAHQFWGVAKKQIVQPKKCVLMCVCVLRGRGEGVTIPKCLRRKAPSKKAHVHANNPLALEIIKAESIDALTQICIQKEERSHCYYIANMIVNLLMTPAIWITILCGTLMVSYQKHVLTKRRQPKKYNNPKITYQAGVKLCITKPKILFIQ